MVVLLLQLKRRRQTTQVAAGQFLFQLDLLSCVLAVAQLPVAVVSLDGGDTGSLEDNIVVCGHRVQLLLLAAIIVIHNVRLVSLALAGRLRHLKTNSNLLLLSLLK